VRADELRRTFIRFFEERGHTLVPSAGLIPTHPTAPLFTNSGMMQFVPYFLGEETAPYPRATSVQKCVRLSGKHNDISELGRTRRHLTFFEMLGNFSFGDYFKEQAIPLAWELTTEVVGFDGDRLWVTVHENDDEAEAIWHESVGVPMERIQRLGTENFWEMGETGPCGPSSEIHLDCGPEWGEAGGPAHGGGDRYVEFWNLVFPQYYRHPDRSLSDLPRRGIDTGAGLERWLMLLDGTRTVFETDVMAALVDEAQSVTGRRLGTDEQTDVALRILADHARTMTFLVSDGVVPSNEDRGYVLRRVIRRAVRYAHRLGVERPATPALVTKVIDVMGDAYPELQRNGEFVAMVVGREEDRFRRTLASGSALLDEALGELDGGALPGDVAFKLHDTFGFPLEVTSEVAAERGVQVDVEGFEAAMAEQRQRGRAGRAAGGEGQGDADYRELLDQFGTTEFVGYTEGETDGRVLAALQRPDGTLEVFLDRTPFYAESGGQVGDTGAIVTPTGRLEVVDATYALPGLHRHVARLVEGEVVAGQEAHAAIDEHRRDYVKRNHTGTHLLHWALREVLGEHVHQQGSLVAPDHLRFDFSHYGQPTVEELAAVEDLANAEVLDNQTVRIYETTREHAEEIGAMAFFGDKYGEVVRVVEAGRRSLELCGGTHVRALGDIGPIGITGEGSIGANGRRISATTGTGTLERLRRDGRTLTEAARALGVRPDELLDGLERTLEQVRFLRKEVEGLRRSAATSGAAELAAEAVDGVVVARRDGVPPPELKDLATAVRDQPGVRGVVLAGAPPKGGVSLIAAVRRDSGLDASVLLADAATSVGGGAPKDSLLAQGGGRFPEHIDAALDLARAAAGLPTGTG
jgi:alanyl-tRNA synthetase